MAQDPTISLLRSLSRFFFTLFGVCLDGIFKLGKIICCFPYKQFKFQFDWNSFVKWMYKTLKNSVEKFMKWTGPKSRKARSHTPRNSAEWQNGAVYFIALSSFSASCVFSLLFFRPAVFSAFCPFGLFHCRPFVFWSFVIRPFIVLSSFSGKSSTKRKKTSLGWTQAAIPFLMSSLGYCLYNLFELCCLLNCV